jgi:hypothetical protein
VNGYPNTFWGWGGEDDELMLRLKEKKLQLVAPQTGTIYDMEQMSIDTKINFLKAHSEWKCNVKREVLNEHATTWQQNGLNTLKYEIESEIVSEDECVTTLMVDVQLNGHWTDTTFNWQDMKSEPQTHRQ